MSDSEANRSFESNRESLMYHHLEINMVAKREIIKGNESRGKHTVSSQRRNFYTQQAVLYNNIFVVHWH